MKDLLPRAGYRTRLSYVLATSTLMVLGNVPAHAALTFARIFTSEMVLQREMPVNVWGFGAGSNATVTVTFNGQTNSTTAAANGSWRVILNPMSANATGQSITVSSGVESQTCTNVVVGEVWMCGGQSNMARTFQEDISGGYTNREADRLLADYPSMRFKVVVSDINDEPLTDLRPGPYSCPSSAVELPWRVVTPSSVLKCFSMAYYFGQKLHETLGVPVGLLEIGKSGTGSYTWLREEALTNVVSSADLQTAYANHDADLAAAGYASWQALLDAIDAWDASPPCPSTRPGKYYPLNNRPCSLFNGIVNPVAGYTLRGLIWHRGENGEGGTNHARVLQAMVNDWRALWGRKFHVIVGTLVTNGDPDGGIPAVPGPRTVNAQYLINQRDSAAQRREIENYNLVCFFDIGNYWRENLSQEVKDANGPHFEAKDVAGERMAVTALDSVYGQTNPDYRTPIPNRAVLEANGRVRVSDDNVGTGLSLNSSNFYG